jgi:hypothetical protein
MHSATRGIELGIEPGDIERTGTDRAEIERAEIKLVEVESVVELVGGLGGGAAACAPPQSEQWL